MEGKMYVIDYKNKTIAKFNNKELSDFLNSGYEKNRYLFSDNKQNAKRIIRLAISFFAKYKQRKAA
jgi:hypothetical protein